MKRLLLPPPKGSGRSNLIKFMNCKSDRKNKNKTYFQTMGRIAAIIQH